MNLLLASHVILLISLMVAAALKKWLTQYGIIVIAAPFIIAYAVFLFRSLRKFKKNYLIQVILDVEKVTLIGGRDEKCLVCLPTELSVKVKLDIAKYSSVVQLYHEKSGTEFYVCVHTHTRSNKEAFLFCYYLSAASLAPVQLPQLKYDAISIGSKAFRQLLYRHELQNGLLKQKQMRPKQLYALLRGEKLSWVMGLDS